VTRPIGRRSGDSSAARGLALAASPVLLLLLAARALGGLACDSWQAVLRPGPATLDQAVTAVCASLAAALLAWLLIALLVSLAAALLSNASTAGVVAARGARLLAPTILRNAVAGLLGVAILATPAAARGGPVPPMAVTASAPVSVTVTEQIPVAGLSPNWPARMTAAEPTSPSLTSPSLTSPARTPSAPTSPVRESPVPPSADRAVPPPPGSPETSAAPPIELSPGWVPSRPAPDPRSGSRTGTLGSSGSRSTASRSAPRIWPSPTGTLARSNRTAADDEIVVRRGDTLWSLASRHLGPGATDAEIATEWPRWFTMNRHVIGADPDHLLPGERLRPPGSELLTRAAGVGDGAAR
jgi:resuscitation-promoting factor RpfA